MTSNARTTYGLLRSAIEDPDPVVVLEPRVLYAEREEYEFDRNYRIPLGQAEIVRKGTDATLVTCGAMVRVALAAADSSKANIEVIDLLTLWPWDRKTVAEFGRADRPAGDARGSAGRQRLGRRCRLAYRRRMLFGALKAPPHRITLPDAPVPYNGTLEARFLPSPAYVAEQVDALVSTNKSPAPWWRNAA